MFHLLPFALLALPAFSGVNGTPARRAPLTVHESRDLPSAFISKGKPSADTTLQLRVGLKAKDNAGLEKVLYDVSTPGSASYGKHLSRDEVKAYAAPTADTVSLVSSWLNSSGISNVQTSGPYDDWLVFSTTLSTADTLLNADFETFTHEDTGTDLVRTLQYSLPQDLLAHIDLVHPTTTFSVQPSTFKSKSSTSIPGQVIGSPSANVLKKKKRTFPAQASCDAKAQPEPGSMNPVCLQQIYGIPSTPATQSSNRIAVAGFGNEFAELADLQTFLTQYRPDMSSNTSFTVQTLDGGENTQGSGLGGAEANLDIEYTVGVATGVPVVFISKGNETTEGSNDFLDMANYMNAQDDPPQVFTTSYGNDEPKISTELEIRICNAYMALGARGVSVIFSSGDGGVSGNLPNDCTTFIPAFPSTCPYVTSVGGTYGIQSNETGTSFSSGGFSNVFPIPAYQSQAVSSYLSAINGTNAGLFNASGRAFPDVAAESVNIDYVNNGDSTRTGGTSASAPIFASVVALLNDKLLEAGKPVLGFLNPLLYQNPQVMFDITKGDNPGCNTQGFSAMAGWDPVTGLGTPNFPAMLALAMSS